MKTALQREIEEIECALNNISSVASRRKNPDALSECSRIFDTIRRFSSRRHIEEEEMTIGSALKKSCFDAYSIADKLAMVTMIEIREVLFPLPELKHQAREFGKRFFNNYFQWRDGSDQFSPEEMMGVLETDLQKLTIAKDLLLHTIHFSQTNGLL